jgi:general secretion pathway protein G
MKSRGFTLIELIVVVSIIALLASIGAVMYGGILKNNRDQKRMNDLKSIKQALELYRTDIHYYPSSTDFNPRSSVILKYSRTTYLDPVPTDASSDRYYSYSAKPPACDNDSSIPCTSFDLCALREGSATEDCDSSLVCSLSLSPNNCNMGLSSD